MWPFKREQPCAPKLSPETAALQKRTAELSERIEALGVETRAVAREAEYIRETNHFGAAVTAAMAGRNP